MTEPINFTPDYGAKENSSMIKVIGVGGAGSNAVRHMFLEGIKGVDFLICNTDEKHLEACEVPEKLLIGNGSGAGGNAKVAGEYAEKSEDKIKEFIGEGTKMLFIAAGMGKGTGTGASPVIAKIAKDMGILTVGVVTEPFRLEGKKRLASATAGIEEMSKYVDSLIVINNQNLMKYFGDLDIDAAYVQVDDILKNSVKSIAEIITCTYKQNVDFEDVKATMKESGKALLGTATANGQDRVQKVLDEVLNCPLLENQDISDAKNFLFFITYGPNKKLTLSELTLLEERFEEMQSENVHLIWGHGLDDSLDDSIKLSVVVTNFDTSGSEVEENIINPTNDKIVITIEDDAREATGQIENKIADIEENNTRITGDDKDEVINTGFDNDFFKGHSEPQPVQNTPHTVIFDNKQDIDDDDAFTAIISTPTIARGDIFADMPQREHLTDVAEPVPMYEQLNDDAFDLFKNIAD